MLQGGLVYLNEEPERLGWDISFVHLKAGKICPSAADILYGGPTEVPQTGVTQAVNLNLCGKIDCHAGVMPFVFERWHDLSTSGREAQKGLELMSKAIRVEGGLSQGLISAPIKASMDFERSRTT
jgi:hypothetical protein